MTLVELQRALRQLRCSGMAAGLEGRLLQAQAETLAPIDFLARQTSVDLPLAAIKESRPSWARFARESSLRATL